MKRFGGNGVKKVLYENNYSYICYSLKKETKMFDLEYIKNRCNNENVHFFEVSFATDILNEGTKFYELDAFFDFVKVAKIDKVFGMEIYIQKEDYYITDEIVEQELGRYVDKEIISCIETEINDYNDKIDMLKIDYPAMLIIACLYEGHIFFLDLENEILCEEKELEEPSFILREIVISNEKKVIEVKNRKQERIKDLQEKLKELILNDREFYLSTNQHLRYNYTKKLFDEKLTKEFDLLKEYWSTPHGLPAKGVIDFVDMLWREYGKKTSK